MPHDDRPYSSSTMGVEGVKCPLGFFRAETKVSHPSPEIEIGLGEHGLDGVAQLQGISSRILRLIR